MYITIFRTALLYIAAIIALRVMGKRQIGDMQPGELVITILISELAAIPIQDTTQPVVSGVIAIFMLVVLEVSVSFAAMKLTPLRRLINGRSAVIIKDGVINQKLMRQMRVTVSDLLEVLRGQGVFDLSKVAYAILETNASLSILLKAADQPATAGDVGAGGSYEGIGALVINDGVVFDEGIRLAGSDRKTVFSILKKQGLDPDRVFLMTLCKNGEHYIVERQEKS